MEALFLYILNILIGWILPEATKEAIGLISKETIYYGISEMKLTDAGAIKLTLNKMHHKKSESLVIATNENNSAPDEEMVYHYIYSSYKPAHFVSVNSIGTMSENGEIKIDGKLFYCYWIEHKCYKRVGFSWEPKYA